MQTDRWTDTPTHLPALSPAGAACGAEREPPQTLPAGPPTHHHGPAQHQPLQHTATCDTQAPHGVGWGAHTRKEAMECMSNKCYLSIVGRVVLVLQLALPPPPRPLVHPSTGHGMYPVTPGRTIQPDTPASSPRVSLFFATRTCSFLPSSLLPRPRPSAQPILSSMR